MQNASSALLHASLLRILTDSRWIQDFQLGQGNRELAAQEEGSLRNNNLKYKKLSFETETRHSCSNSVCHDRFLAFFYGVN